MLAESSFRAACHRGGRLERETMLGIHDLWLFIVSGLALNITPGPDTLVTRDHSRRLLEAVADQRLSLAIANYGSTCITFGDFEFADDVVNESIWLIEMADRDEPSQDELRAAIDRLTH